MLVLGPGLRQYAAWADTWALPLPFLPLLRFLLRSFFVASAAPMVPAKLAPSTALKAARRELALPKRRANMSNNPWSMAPPFHA